ncbi:MAG: hypothetical protein CTY33_09210 [Methylotenera sp.]|nr:MAG: hypothetical protein CTY33_09210 [Methylotenera sp.]
MKKHIKLALIIVLAVIATFLVTAYFSTKNTRTAFISASQDMEAFNELHRIKNYDSLEQLLIKGCNKEALEYVRMEQSLGLLHLQDSLKNGARLEKSLETENSALLERAKTITNKGKYFIPSCN